MPCDLVRHQLTHGQNDVPVLGDEQPIHLDAGREIQPPVGQAADQLGGHLAQRFDAVRQSWT